MAGLKYKIPNSISKRELRKQGKNLIPLSLMQVSQSYSEYIKKEVARLCDSKTADLPTKKSPK